MTALFVSTFESTTRCVLTFYEGGTFDVLDMQLTSRLSVFGLTNQPTNRQLYTNPQAMLLQNRLLYP